MPGWNGRDDRRVPRDDLVGIMPVGDEVPGEQEGERTAEVDAVTGADLDEGEVDVMDVSLGLQLEEARQSSGSGVNVVDLFCDGLRLEPGGFAEAST